MHHQNLLFYNCGPTESFTHTTTKPNPASLRLSFRSENGVQNHLLSHHWISLTAPLPLRCAPPLSHGKDCRHYPFAPRQLLNHAGPTSPTSRHLKWLGLPISRGNLNPPWQTQFDRKQGAAGEGWKRRSPLKRKEWQSEWNKETLHSSTERRERRQDHRNRF